MRIPCASCGGLLVLLGLAALAAADTFMPVAVDYQVTIRGQAYAEASGHIPSPGSPAQMISSTNFQTDTAHPPPTLSQTVNALATPIIGWNTWDEPVEDPPGSGNFDMVHHEDPMYGTSVATSASGEAWVTAETDGARLHSQLYRTTPLDPPGQHSTWSWSRMWGTLAVNSDDEHPIDSTVPILLDTDIDATANRGTWDWHAQVRRGTTVLATLNSTNPSQTINGLAGETLSFQFYHIPEPASLAVLLAGAAALLRRRVRRA